ncbi:MAG: hypothetical protein AAGI01_18815, partial [Myxococcota bacterium]
MAADESTDWLVDLLYDEYEGGEAPEADGLTPEQAAEFEALQSLMADVRASLPDAAPGAHVRASLLLAAKDHVESMGVAAAAAAAASDARRPARTGSASRESIWSRARFSTIVQIAAVAIVLVLGAFSWSALQVGADQEPAREAELAAVEQAPADASARLEVDEAKTIALGDRDTKEREPQPFDKGILRALENAPPKQRKVSKRVANRSAEKKKTSPAAPLDSSIAFEGSRGERSTSNSYPTPSKVSSKADAVAQAGAGESPNIASMRRAQSSDNHARTIEEGERFLDAGLGTNKERAEALEAVARAYEARGNSAKANKYWERLRKEHPDQYDRKKIERKRRARKKMRAPQNSYDFEESARPA